MSERSRRRRRGERSHDRGRGDAAVDGSFSGPLASLRRRIYLTYYYLGWRTLLFRALTFPLRFTPLKRRLRLRSTRATTTLRRAVEWYREQGGRSTS